MTQPFVPIEDLAKHFAVSISTIRAWVRQGHIPKSTYIKIGNTYRFNMTAVVAALTTEAEEVAHNELPATPAEVQLSFNFNADDDV